MAAIFNSYLRSVVILSMSLHNFFYISKKPVAIQHCAYLMDFLELKVVWKSVSLALGAQFVMIVGMNWMLLWCADNLDTVRETCFAVVTLFISYSIATHGRI